MSHEKRAVVDPPDSRGLREVRVDGVTVGRAWSLRELRRLLTRSGFPKETELAVTPAVFWHGGGPDIWPDRPLRRRATLVLLVSGLLGSVALLVDIGLPDLFEALTFAGRVMGCMFVVGGFLQAVAAAAAFDHWSKRVFKYSGAVALAGVIIALLVCSLLLALWLQEKEYFPYCLSYFSLWVWALWATWRVCQEKPWQELPHPRRFALGVTVSSVVAATNLAYSGLYQPSTALATMRYEVAFGTPYASPQADNPIMYVPMTVTLENTGTVPFWILGSAVSVYGTRSAPRPNASSIQDWREGEGENQLYAGSPTYTVVYRGPLEDPGGWLEQGEKIVNQRVIQPPRNAPFDSLQASGHLIAMRKDHGSVDSEFVTNHWSREPDKVTRRVACAECGDIGINVGRLHYNNNLVNVTRKPRYVLSIRYMNQAAADADEDFGVVVAPMEKSHNVSPNDEPERLGLVDIGTTVATVSFAQLLKQLR
ncbi:hypothetical protein ACFW7J_27615 [Streptomyces sp. NPDC059525]|uniref:hypothetical protein n=1 Tax=Streptomyces sp. NPDC059525 TaxID=3346857 RepID=UPI0036BC5A4A